jgi:hypothetical protein
MEQWASLSWLSDTVGIDISTQLRHLHAEFKILRLQVLQQLLRVGLLTNYVLAGSNRLALQLRLHLQTFGPEKTLQKKSMRQEHNLLTRYERVRAYNSGCLQWQHIICSVDYHDIGSTMAQTDLCSLCYDTPI